MLLDDDARRDVLRRLHRAQGQLRGITGMVESGRDCADIVTQLAAVVRALDSAGFTIIAAGLRQGAAAPASDVDTAESMARLEKLFLSLA